MAHKLAGTPSPFAKASETGKRLKAFLWGEPGTGKTYLASQFPDAVVIDMEQGTEYVGGKFKFDRIHAHTADEVIEAVSWLLHNPHPYKTLVIDPFTMFWQQIQEKWAAIFLEHNPEGAGNHGEYYELQPKDWQPIKGDVRKLFRMLMQLDMNVIVTAHSKAEYSFGGGEFMKKIGDTFDGEKTLPYVFDVILQLFQDGERYMARVKKDRSGRLPTLPFECNYRKVAELFGVDGLERETVQIAFATDEQIARMTQLFRELGLSRASVKRNLVKYGADSLDSVKASDAASIIGSCEARLEQSRAADFVDAGASATGQQ